jgi:hypothetical protein
MPRGTVSKVGETMVNANGYSCTRTSGGWRFTHHMIAEAKLGRPINSETETVKFADGNNSNLNPNNIIVTPKKTPSANTRLAKLYAWRAEIDAEIRDIEAKLAKGKPSS